MNAVEIAEAVSELFQQEWNPAEFPFAFLEAFGNKETTIKRLRQGDSNASDVPGGVLQRNNIHLAVCAPGTVSDTFQALKTSPKTAAGKVKFLLATDGEWLEAEELVSGEPLSTPYAELPNHFAFFLPLAGISTVAEIKENPIDIRATGRLNKLYVELLKENPEWATEARRPDMNHFMARLIFCFFAEDTHIFHGSASVTKTVMRFTEPSGANVHEVIETLFRVMDMKPADRRAAKLPLWAENFPYVNGHLFSGSTVVPRFTRIARSYLLRAGELNWREINPDIFGSMIQAVADDKERGALGMHYTSVPNILKVLNPLFLDDLRSQLEAAGDSPVKLLNLRNRMAHIRVFDPACGSGNFLVIAYKEMRKIEAQINLRRGEFGRGSEIPLTNFRGIELRDFAAEIARLALIIAEFQCDVLYLGPLEANAVFLPLDQENWIVQGNALRLNWLTVCPPDGKVVKIAGTDLFTSQANQIEIGFRNEGGETYICGNPPYSGYNKQSVEQKEDLQEVFSTSLVRWGNLDYVAAWLFKASQYLSHTEGSAAFVMTNTICQGGQVAVIWSHIFANQQRIKFAYTSFSWSNLAAKNAGITVVIVGISRRDSGTAQLFSLTGGNQWSMRAVENISAYLTPGDTVFVSPANTSISGLHKMNFGNHPYFGAPLFFSVGESLDFIANCPESREFLRPIYGSTEIIHGRPRMCIWVSDDLADAAGQIAGFKERFEEVRRVRANCTDGVQALS